MKKFSSMLLSLILFFTCLGIAGCSDDEYDNYTVDLSKMEVGDAIPVYPNCEFDYILTPNSEIHPEVDKEYTFHISSITAKLVKKNIISTNDVVSEQFYPFEIRIDTAGYTFLELAGYTFSIKVCCQTSFIDIASIDCVISPTGEFEGFVVFGIYDAKPSPLYFSLISKYFW